MAISREDAMDITFDNVEVVEKPSISPQPSEEPPNHHVRWFHAGPTTLLSIAPITLSTTTNWQPLTREESDLCEEAWRELTPEDQAEASQRDIDPNEDDDDMKIGIPISRDRLFEVDVKAMKLYPVFWSTAGEISVMRGQWMHDETRPVETPMSQILENAYRVVKPWHSSYVEELQTALEHGYEALDKLKHPLVSASLDPNSTAKPDTFVIFEDEAVARVFTGTIRKPFTAFLSGLSRSKPPPPTLSQLGGTVYYRGIDEATTRIQAAKAQAASKSPSTSRPSSPQVRPRSSSGSSTRSEARGRKSLEPPPEKKARTGSLPPKSTEVPKPNQSSLLLSSIAAPKQDALGSIIPESLNTAATGTSTTITPASTTTLNQITVPVDTTPVSGGPTISVEPRIEDDMSSVTDLILVVHGIGQGLTATYEAFDFVYATNMFRDVARKQSQSPAISSMMKDSRIQFLPVQWRASLKLDVGEELAKAREGLDNRFTLADITLKNTIPFIRDLTNNVLLDIPLFMSHHRERMIHSVCSLANRTYRLWCARNPGFEKHGRVHIMAHSLGSALVTHILSVQPTRQPPLSEMDAATLRTKEHFLFNTSNLFLIGSPLGVFIHLNQSQIIARKGRARTKDSPPDEALERAGIFGCLAIDSLYNIFNPADPVVYLLNPCVDAQKAVELPATAIPNVNEGMISSWSTTVSKMFGGIAPWSSTTTTTATSSKAVGGAKTARNADPEEEGAIEIELASGGLQENKGTKAERRFAALNPHGTLDFYLPSEGNISEYVDMITAHSSYWNDPSLAAFVLTEIYATQEDLMRTSVGFNP